MTYCRGQTTIKRSSDFTHMMIIKITVKFIYLEINQISFEQFLVIWNHCVTYCWGQTTIKRSSDFTHMMIIKITVRVKYGKWYWNPHTFRPCVYLTTLQLLIFTLQQTISNSNSNNIHKSSSNKVFILLFFTWTLQYLL